MIVEQFLQFADAWPEAMLLVTADGTILSGNRALEGLLDLSSKELDGRRLDEIAECPGGAAAYLRACSRSRHLLPGSLAFRTADGRVVPCRAQGAVLQPRTDHSAALILLRLTARATSAQQFLALNEKIEELSKEVRQRREAQARLETALRDKEVLLREVHHRVKNNMQVIAGLLDLHTIQVKDRAAVQVLQEAKGRIHVMAQVHQRLYATEDLESVDLEAFLREIVPQLVRIYKGPGQDIDVLLTLDPVSANLDTALACGLLVHELVSNAIKHAFPDRDSGTIELALTGTGNGGNASLCVSDNGVGMPEGFDPRNAPTLGTQLIYSLSRQIGGTVSMDAQRGTTFTITFGGVRRAGPLSSG